MVGVVRLQVLDTQLASGLLDGAGLLDQGGDGVADLLLAVLVVRSDHLVEVHAILLGAVDDGLQLGLGVGQVGLQGVVGGGVGLGDQVGQARALTTLPSMRLYSPR